MTDDARPETIDDLPDWERRDTVARFELTPGGFAYGLGAAVDQLVNAYGEVYADAMTVESATGQLYIYRDLTADELQKQLEFSQRMWDRQHPEQASEVASDD